MLDGRAHSPVADARNRTAARLLPLATLLVLTGFLALTSADADLFGHLTFGRDIVRVHAVHASDPYSFTSDRAWVNHEWLAEAIMWIGYALGGGVGLIVLKLSLAWAAGALLLDAWRRYQLTPIQRDLLLFVDVLGFTPTETLVAATRLGGEIMGLGSELGQVKAGYLADLLLVDGNPLTDIKRLQDQDALLVIMKDGRLHKGPPAA